MRPAALPALALLAAFAALGPSAGARADERFFVVDAVKPRPAGDVLEVAAASGRFTHFLEAAEATGFAGTLRGPGPFTVFAPTDAAIRALPEGEWERLTHPRNRERLLALLAYHVVAERITADSANGVTRPETAGGYRLTLDGRDGLRVNDELVVVQDMQAANGVLHGLNALLTPPVMVAALPASAD